MAAVHALTSHVFHTVSSHVAHAEKTCATLLCGLNNVVVVRQHCREASTSTLVQSLCCLHRLTHDELVEGSTDVCGLQLADRVSGSTEDESRWQHALGFRAEHLSALCSVQDHSADSKGEDTRTERDEVLSVVVADWQCVHKA